MSTAPLPAQITDRYPVDALLGQGSFGRTYLARDLEADGRPVAIKQLRAEGEDLWKRHELFEREAAVLGALRHQGIPQVHAHLRVPRERGEDIYLVMEYIAGDSLAAIIERRQPMDPARLLALLLGLLDILDYLHTRVPPVLHRDIKPSNVIVRPGGAPALVDFGAVRSVFKRPDEGGSTIVGTHGYMPFEQYMGQASPASDLYAVGATFLHLLTGRAPAEFVGPAGRIEVPAELPGGPTLRAVITRLLAPNPADRYPSAHAVRDALLGAAATAPVTTSLVPSPGVTALAPLDDPAARERRLAELAASPAHMLFPNLRPSERLGGYLVFYVLAILLTGGVIALVTYLTYRHRRQRLARFLRDGQPAAARLLGQSFTTWTYEFTVDGVTHRGDDAPLMSIARRWQAGDTVQIMYIAADRYDSVIVETA